MDQKIIQNSLHCCIASYKDSPYTYLEQTGVAFCKSEESEKFQKLKENGHECINKRICVEGHKCTIALVDSILYIAFQGTSDLADILNDVSIKMVKDESHWSDSKDVKFHSGFLERAEKELKLVKSIISELKPKQVVLCGHSLGAAVSGNIFSFYNLITF